MNEAKIDHPLDRRQKAMIRQLAAISRGLLQVIVDEEIWAEFQVQRIKDEIKYMIENSGD